MSKSRFIKLLLGVPLIATAYCTQPAPTSQTPKTTADSYTVRIKFDGGYATIRDKKAGTLTVAAFNASDKGGYTDTGEHGMQMSVYAGAIEKNGNDVLAPDDEQQLIWNLAGTEDMPFQIAVDGQTSVKAPNRSSKNDCDAIPDQKADTYKLVPNIQELAKTAGVKDVDINATKLRNRVTVNGLDYRIDRVASCWEVLVDGKKDHEQRLPAGIGGVEVYYNNVTADTFNIKVTHGADVKYVRVRPVEIAGQREAVIWFGRFPHCPPDMPCTIAEGAENPDFPRFFHLLNGPLPKANNQGKEYFRLVKSKSKNALSPFEKRSPGDECPGGDYDGPLSVVAPATKSGGN